MDSDTVKEPSQNQSKNVEMVDSSTNTEDLWLLVDIGGTNCRMFLYSPDEKELFRKFYVTNRFADFEEAVDQFLEEAHCLGRISLVVASVAASVKNNVSTKFSNCRWGKINGPEIQKMFNLDGFSMYNDFKAMALGLKILDDSSQDVDVVVEGEQENDGFGSQPSFPL